MDEFDHGQLLHQPQRQGRIPSGQFAFSIGVIESRDNQMPIGTPFESGSNDGGLPV
jgi:hypothetical protein